MKKELQGQPWYVSGRLYSKKPLLLAIDSKSGYDWSAKFMANGKLVMEETTKESSFDANGKEIGPGLHYTDSTITYELKKDLVKIDYSIPATKDSKGMTRISFYKINRLADKKGYELVPIAASEFK
jgi:hypothetical protein